MNTRALVLGRLFHTVVTLFFVLTMMWALFRLVPGDPLVIFLGQGLVMVWGSLRRPFGSNKLRK